MPCCLWDGPPANVKQCAVVEIDETPDGFLFYRDYSYETYLLFRATVAVHLSCLP